MLHYDKTARRIEDKLATVAASGHDAIESRLRELDSEWSVGRMVKVSTGALILVGLGLTAYVSPLFVVLPAVGGLLLAQYIYMRGCWLCAGFAAMGFRPGVEIAHERTALQALRGDFRHLPTIHEIEDRDAVTRFEDEGGPAYDHDHPRVDPREAAREVVAATRH